MRLARAPRAAVAALWLSAAAAAAGFAAAAAPAATDAHLSVAADGRSYVVSWSAPAEQAAARASSLSWGTDASSLSSSSPADVRVLTTSRSLSVARAAVDASALAPGATVFYRTAEDGSAPLLNFTVRDYGAGAPVTLAVFGDLGVKEQEGANYTLALLADLQRGSAGAALGGAGAAFDAVLHVGDIAYDMFESGGERGDEFLQDMAPIASAVPYLTCPGNHERECDVDYAVAGCAANPPYASYRARFDMPRPAAARAPRRAAAPPAAAGPPAMHWSADLGAVHVVSLNTDWYIQDGTKLSAEALATLAAQTEWLKADLKAVDRTRTPFVVAIGHIMMYSTFDTEHLTQAARVRDGWSVGSQRYEGLEDIFYQYGVDVYFSGHEHVYEAYERTYKNQSDPAGTAYIVVGNAGNREFPYSKHDTWLKPVPDNMVARSEYPSGFGLLSANATALTWRQFDARARKVIDEHSIPARATAS